MKYKITCEHWNAPVISYNVEDAAINLDDNVAISFKEKNGNTVIVPWSRVFNIEEIAQ